MNVQSGQYHQERGLLPTVSLAYLQLQCTQVLCEALHIPTKELAAQMVQGTIPMARL